MIVGLDMGGTHVDAVAIEDGKIINTSKKPTDRKNLFNSIWTTLEDLLQDEDISKIKRINLSTTVCTNAIVEDKTDSVGMFIQSGPGLSHDFLACGDENVFLSGYIDHRGRVVKNFDPEEIKESANLFKEKGIKSCAIVTKFSTRNPKHELKIKNLIEKDFSPITLGHNMSGKLNFPRRVYTSYLNSAVYNTFNEFSKSIKKSMEIKGISAPLYILKADGGTMSLSSAEENPVETILSGPAASFMGINAMLGTDKDAILLDVGGTTTDIFFLADGVPLFEPLGIKIGDYKTLVRAIYSVSIGLGGDSSIKIVENKLKIGPKKEGYPFAFGGPSPTPTDAMIVLGFMDDGDKNKAYEAMNMLGAQLNLSAEQVAEKIMDIMADMIKEKVDDLLYEINSHPVYTVKELLYGKKIEPKLINIIGGPAKVLTPFLEKKFSLPCYFPKNYHVANAAGAALAKTTTEITMLADTSQKTLSVPELGIYERIGGSFSMDLARKKTLELIEEKAKALGAGEDEIDPEITEESSFNIVRGFYTSGKNIRIKAQVKPGLIYKLRGVQDD